MMKKIILIGFIWAIIFSCSTTKDVPNIEEISEVLKAFGKTNEDSRTIYYKSWNNYSNLQKETIEEPGKLFINVYNKNYRTEWISKIDSLTNTISDLTYQEKDSIVDIVNEKFRINPGKLFSSRDRKFMLEQFENRDVLKWKNMEHGSIKFTKSKDAKKISLPFFSKDYRLAMIFIASPGFEGVEVYKKVNGNWKFYFGATLVIYD